MTINEAAFMLGVSKDQLLEIITNGSKLPKSGEQVKIVAKEIGGELFVEDADLDSYLARFEAEEPGRTPPIEVRRELLVEARHRCGICDDRVSRLQYHHILEWEKVEHHDPKHMIAICGTCHDECGIGKIDKASQWRYKAKLKHPEYTVSGTDDEGRAAKYKRDVATLEALFTQLHTGVVDQFLYEAGFGYLTERFSTFFWEGFNGLVSSTKFYLYDETAWTLIREFHGHAGALFDYHGWMHENSAGDKQGFSERYAAVDGFDKAVNEFRVHAAEAESAYRKLYAYLRENYLDLDFEKTDAIAWEDYRKHITEPFGES